MQRLTARMKLTNFVDPERSVELRVFIDTGKMIVLPQGIVDELGLRKLREVRVRYVNGTTEKRGLYGVVTAEVAGRAGEFDVVALPEGYEPTAGQILLDQLDLVLDPVTVRVTPDPRSPDMPMVEVL